MKITNWKKKLISALVAGGMFVSVTGTAADLGTNLLNDPGFEDVGTAYTYGAYLNSWQDGTGTDYAYAVSAGYDNGNPLEGGGLYYFNSNYAAPDGDVLAPGVVAQSVDVSGGDSAVAIASGAATFDLSGFFSSYEADGDFGTMEANFLDVAGGSLLVVSISDSDTTGWTLEGTTGDVPVGTSSILVSLYGTALAGGPDGYIDNVDLTINQIPEPTAIFLAGLGMTGVGVLTRRRRGK